MSKKEICHVCKKEKKPYTIIIDDNAMSLVQYQMAREDGPICERCDQYCAMTNIKKEPTKKEFEIAVKAQQFANMMLRWWEKDKKMDYNKPESCVKDWEGTYEIAKWCREYLQKEEKTNGKEKS